MTPAEGLSARLKTLQEAGRISLTPWPGLGALALALTAEDPDRVVISQGGCHLTRGDLVGLAQRLGGALQARGLKKGSVVAFQLPNWWEACVVNMAAALFGWRIVPLLPIYRAAELGTILPACGVEAIFVPAATPKIDHAALVRGLDQVPPAIITVRGDSNDPDRFETLLDHEPGAPQIAPVADAKLILFTSGSTGRPKGVIHTHASLDSAVRVAAKYWGLDEDDVLYVPSPIGHIGGSIYAFEFPWITGCRTILEDHWEPSRAVACIDREKVTFMAGATPFLRGLLDAAEAAGSRLPCLRHFICGGASVPPVSRRPFLRICCKPHFSGLPDL